MVHSIRIFVVAEPLTVPFINALRSGGLWHHLARQTQPGLIGTDVFQCSSLESFFVVVDFWTSEQAYRTARRNPAHSVLEQFLRNLTRQQLDLGLFAISMRSGESESVPDPAPVEDEVTVN
jgi:heme-degrading monooxygenase HmoA